MEVRSTESSITCTVTNQNLTVHSRPGRHRTGCCGAGGNARRNDPHLPTSRCAQKEQEKNSKEFSYSEYAWAWGTLKKVWEQVARTCSQALSLIRHRSRCALERSIKPQNMPAAEIMLNPYSAKQRYRKVTICARVQVSFGPNVVAVIPFVMACSTAHCTASA